MGENVRKSSNIIKTEAVFSECGNYRYSLSRKVVGMKGKITFIMFNPNVRDDIKLGATANYCFNYAVDMGYGETEIVNLFALRTKNVRTLKELVKSEGVDPVGSLNNFYISKSIKKVDKVVLAWGSNGGFQRRDKKVFELLKGLKVFCFDKSAKGKPGYPKRSLGLGLIPF